jgi:hypothetical protein
MILKLPGGYGLCRTSESRDDHDVKPGQELAKQPKIYYIQLAKKGSVNKNLCEDSGFPNGLTLIAEKRRSEESPDPDWLTEKRRSGESPDPDWLNTINDYLSHMVNTETGVKEGSPGQGAEYSAPGGNDGMGSKGPGACTPAMHRSQCIGGQADSLTAGDTKWLKKYLKKMEKMKKDQETVLGKFQPCDNILQLERSGQTLQFQHRYLAQGYPCGYIHADGNNPTPLDSLS